MNRSVGNEGNSTQYNGLPNGYHHSTSHNPQVFDMNLSYASPPISNINEQDQYATALAENTEDGDGINHISQVIIPFLEVIKEYILSQQLHHHSQQTTNQGVSSQFEQFKRLCPSTFDGKRDPLLAKRWIRQVEKTFEVIECAEERKVPLASFILEENADSWWITKKRILEEEGKNITWKEFKDAFYEQYLPISVQQRKEHEFLCIQQESMTVTEYDDHFTKLSDFVQHINFNDAQMARHFERGLRSFIRDRIAILQLPTYIEVVNKALIVEKIEEDRKKGKDRKHQLGVASSSNGRPLKKKKKKKK